MIDILFHSKSKISLGQCLKKLVIMNVKAKTQF